jgi:multidrug efflux pump subunit AcrB
MRFTHFFIDRPIFAAVLSIILTIAGVLVERALPISEYPEIAPPTVSIRATYPGASAEVLAQTGHRRRYRAGAGAEPCLGRRAAPAG